MSKTKKMVSAEKLAKRFCDEMIKNLRHNVGEQKKRLASRVIIELPHQPVTRYSPSVRAPTGL